MSQDDASSISVIAFRAERYSQDGKSIVVSFRTKFSSAERKYLVPMECLRDFIVDLQRLDASPDAAFGKSTSHQSDSRPALRKGSGELGTVRPRIFASGQKFPSQTMERVRSLRTEKSVRV